MLTHPDSAFKTTLLPHEENLIERLGQAQHINTRSAHSGTLALISMAFSILTDCSSNRSWLIVFREQRWSSRF